MSSIEVHNPRFDDFHGDPVVTWRHKNGPIQVAVNLLEQYQRWRTTRMAKHEPVPAFWETNGPAIVRALGYCGAKALVFRYVSDRRVAYQWFGRSPDATPSSAHANTYHLCSVVAEGGSLGSDSRVHVILPTEEEIHFAFLWREMQKWLKESPAESPVELEGPDKRIGEGIE